jgi:uncharacterized protein YecT (DUF1311 family)
MRKLFFIFCFLCFFTNFSYGQNLATLKRLDKKYQDCLDTGINMLLCTQKYYTSIDSLLNIAYKNYRGTLTEKQKQVLKVEQLKWISLRDNYFKKIDNKLSVEQGSTDARIIAKDDKAQFVRERVIYFIKKLNL